MGEEQKTIEEYEGNVHTIHDSTQLYTKGESFNFSSSIGEIALTSSSLNAESLANLALAFLEWYKEEFHQTKARSYIR